MESPLRNVSWSEYDQPGKNPWDTPIQLRIKPGPQRTHTVIHIHCPTELSWLRMGYRVRTRNFTNFSCYSLGVGYGSYQIPGWNSFIADRSFIVLIIRFLLWEIQNQLKLRLKLQKHVCHLNEIKAGYMCGCKHWWNCNTETTGFIFKFIGK